MERFWRVMGCFWRGFLRFIRIFTRNRWLFTNWCFLLSDYLGILTLICSLCFKLKIFLILSGRLCRKITRILTRRQGLIIFLSETNVESNFWKNKTNNGKKYSIYPSSILILKTSLKSSNNNKMTLGLIFWAKSRTKILLGLCILRGKIYLLSFLGLWIRIRRFCWGRVEFRGRSWWVRSRRSWLSSRIRISWLRNWENLLWKYWKILRILRFWCFRMSFYWKNLWNNGKIRRKMYPFLKKSNH